MFYITIYTHIYIKWSNKQKPMFDFLTLSKNGQHFCNVSRQKVIKKNTATGGDETDVDADERPEASGRDQVALHGSLLPANRVPTRAAAVQKLSPLLFPLLLLGQLLLSSRRRHFCPVKENQK